MKYSKKWLGLIALLIASVALAAGYERIPKDTLILGSGTSSDKVLQFDNGSANPASIRLNNATNTIQFANDGQNFLDLGSGSSSGINFVENSNAETSATENLTLSGVSSTAESASNLVDGKQSFKLTPSGSFTADWSLRSIPSRWNGSQFGIEALVDVPALDNGVTLTVGLHDGTNFVESYEITQSDTYRVQLIAPYDSGETYTFRIASTAGTPTATGIVFVDNVYVGPSVPVIGQSIADKIALRYFTDGVSKTINTQHRYNYSQLDYNYNCSSCVTTGVNAWKFTTPRAGRFLVTAGLLMNVATWSAGTEFSGEIRVNGTRKRFYHYREQQASNVEYPYLVGTSTLDLQAGDEVYVTYNAGNGSSTYADTVGDYTYIEINELSDSKQTTYAVNPQIEYAYNDSGITTASAVDSTSFAYGPEGVAIGAINSTTANAATVFTVKFKTPIRDSDQITLEVKRSDFEGWTDIAYLSSVHAYYNQSSSVYGVGIDTVTTVPNAVRVLFGNKGRVSAGGYAGNGNTWSEIATWRWRVRKISAGAAAIPVATPQTFGTVKTNKVQIKNLDNAYTFAGTSTIGALSFNNLTIGKWYELHVKARIICENGDFAYLFTEHDGAINTLVGYSATQNSGATLETSHSDSIIFQATATSLVAKAGLNSGSNIAGSTSGYNTRIILKELNNFEVTNEW